MPCHMSLKATSIDVKITQSNRIGAFNKFKSWERNISFATDVGSRGINIQNIDVIVNYYIFIESVKLLELGKQEEVILLLHNTRLKVIRKLNIFLKKTWIANWRKPHFYLHEKVLEALLDLPKEKLKKLPKIFKLLMLVIESNPDNEWDEGNLWAFVKK